MHRRPRLREQPRRPRPDARRRPRSTTTANDVAGVAALRDELRGPTAACSRSTTPRPRRRASDWALGHDVVPDTVEVWNISRLYQPPLPSASDNDAADRALGGLPRRRPPRRRHRRRPTATGRRPSPSRASGSPTTWVFAADRPRPASSRDPRAGRTTISARAARPGRRPPVPRGRRRRRRHVRGDGRRHRRPPARCCGRGSRARPAPSSDRRERRRLGVRRSRGQSPAFEHRFRVPHDGTWVRAEVGAATSRTSAPRRATRSSASRRPTAATCCCRRGDDLGALPRARAAARRSRSTVEDGTVTLGNAVVERTWSLRRSAPRRSSTCAPAARWAPANDFRLLTSTGRSTGDDLDGRRADHASAAATRRRRVRLHASTLAHSVVDRVQRLPRRRRLPQPHDRAGAGVLSGYTLDEVAVRGAAATAHAFSAGYDWRGSDDRLGSRRCAVRRRAHRRPPRHHRRAASARRRRRSGCRRARPTRRPASSW